MTKQPRPNDQKEIADPNTPGPDPGTPGDAIYFVWQKMGEIQHTLGKIDQRLTSDSTTVSGRLDEIDRKLRLITGKVEKVSAKISKITWIIVGGAGVLTLVSPLIWIAIKSIFKIV